jgi:hypothetical protein
LSKRRVVHHSLYPPEFRSGSKAPIAGPARSSADIRSSPKPDADDPGIPSGRGRRAYCGFAGSPTATKGAHSRGSASASDFAPSIIASMDCRSALACESFGSRAFARNVPISSLAVASSLTLQWETISGATNRSAGRAPTQAQVLSAQLRRFKIGGRPSSNRASASRRLRD